MEATGLPGPREWGSAPLVSLPAGQQCAVSCTITWRGVSGGGGDLRPHAPRPARRGSTHTGAPGAINLTGCRLGAAAAAEVPARAV